MEKTEKDELLNRINNLEFKNNKTRTILNDLVEEQKELLSSIEEIYESIQGTNEKMDEIFKLLKDKKEKDKKVKKEAPNFESCQMHM